MRARLAESGVRRIALVHEWLDQRAGSEKVFERIAQLLPDAELFALSMTPDCELDLGGRAVQTTILGHKLVRDRRALSLLAMPLVWSRTTSPSRYDLVISSSHAFARYFAPARDTLHLSYCHAPLRYAWSAGRDRRGPPPVRSLAAMVRPVIRRLDRASVRWTESFAANSRETAERIRRFYDRPAKVVYPPVDVEFFGLPCPIRRGAYLLAVSRFVPYKRVDLVITAAALAGLPLVVAGSGPLERSLRKFARARYPGSVHFVVRPSDVTLRNLYAGAAALVFPAFEDFGIVAVEAQAAGTSVVALSHGGCVDTVIDGRTGALVGRQSADAFAAAIRRVTEDPPRPDACRANARRFSIEAFDRRFTDWVLTAVAAHTGRRDARRGTSGHRWAEGALSTRSSLGTLTTAEVTSGDL